MIDDVEKVGQMESFEKGTMIDGRYIIKERFGEALHDY